MGKIFFKFCLFSLMRGRVFQSRQTCNEVNPPLKVINFISFFLKYNEASSFIRFCGSSEAPAPGYLRIYLSTYTWKIVNTFLATGLTRGGSLRASATYKVGKSYLVSFHFIFFLKSNEASSFIRFCGSSEAPAPPQVYSAHILFCFFCGTLWG